MAVPRRDEGAGPHSRAEPSRSRTFLGWPVFGGWLPMIAFYDPPCQADGRPWNGVKDPGYRITILALGWLNHGFSVTVGAPRPAGGPGRDREAALNEAVAALDRRLDFARDLRAADAPQVAWKIMDVAPRGHGSPPILAFCPGADGDEQIQIVRWSASGAGPGWCDAKGRPVRPVRWAALPDAPADL
ncbi:hypothetical protein [Methylobacterium nigriterrae]|uniref:hypothetical protein n=1 Tax=Methylobacterium nigriterrae TaxID=3127512 RepID=UPI00301356DB